MDPRIIGAEQWLQIQQALAHLVLFAALVVNGVLAFLMGHAVIPSLIVTGDAPQDIGRYRSVLYGVFAVSMLLMVYALVRALILAYQAIDFIYPRFWI